MARRRGRVYCVGPTFASGVAKAIRGALLGWAILTGEHVQAETSLGGIETLQYLLIWTGDYKGAVDGVIGPRTKAAFQAYIFREFGRAPSDLTEEYVEPLIKAGAAAMQEAGFLIHRDEELDVVYGIPGAIVQPVPGPKRFRKTYRSPDGSVEIEIAYLRNQYTSLDELYRRLTTLSGRSVTYSVFHPTWFALSGLDRGRRFYARYYGSGAEIRGFSVSYLSEREQSFDPVVVAMSNVFRPSAAANDEFIVFLFGLQSEQKPPEDPNAPGPKSAAFEISGSGFLIDAKGHILTNAHVVKGCSEVTIGKTAGRVVASDEANDLALLNSVDSGAMSPLVLRSDRVNLGEDVVAFGFPLSDILANSVNVTSGLVSSLSGIGNDSRYVQMTAPVQPGNSGGPLVDRGGEVVGIVTGKLKPTRTADDDEGPYVPEGVNFAIRVDTIKPFLEANHIDFALAPRSPAKKSVEELAASIGPSVVLIRCIAAAE